MVQPITLRGYSLLTLICLCLLGSFVGAGQAAGPVSEQQMQALLPDEQDLPGFTRIPPTGQAPLEDKVTVDADATQWLLNWTPLAENPGQFSQIMRSLYSNNGIYQITMTVNICNSPTTAAAEVAEFLRGCSTRFAHGRFNGQGIVGDDSWFNPSGYSTMIFRYGNMVVLLDGILSFETIREGGHAPFPTQAVEAVAYQIVLQASQQASLKGASAQNTHLAVNDHTLPKNALKVAGRVYVPVQEFAKAMGRTYAWNAKTGALTLSGPKGKTVTLTAGSTQTSVGGEKAAALAVPVLKSDGQPVMTLDDLLRLTGGRIISHVGNTVQVKG